jgi:hypothetical protein
VVKLHLPQRHEIVVTLADDEVQKLIRCRCPPLAVIENRGSTKREADQLAVDLHRASDVEAYAVFVPPYGELREPHRFRR